MNSTELLSAIRREWLGPSKTELGADDTKLLALADQFLTEELLPQIVDLSEDYVIAEDRLTLSAAVNAYDIPERAFGSQVRAVQLNPSGSSQQEGVTWIRLDQKARYANVTGQTYVAYLQGDQIILPGEPAGTMDIQYPWRPGALVTSDNFRVVSSVNTTTKVVTLTATVPTAWATGAIFDFHSSKQSGQPRTWSLTSSNVSGTQITFTDEIDGSDFGRQAIAAGDYCVLEHKAAIPQIPRDAHGLIALGVCMHLATQQGDPDILKLFEHRYLMAFDRVQRMLDQRVEQIRPIINYNSRFRRSSYVGYRRRWV